MFKRFNVTINIITKLTGKVSMMAKKVMNHYFLPSLYDKLFPIRLQMALLRQRNWLYENITNTKLSVSK